MHFPSNIFLCLFVLSFCHKYKRSIEFTLFLKHAFTFFFGCKLLSTFGTSESLQTPQRELSQLKNLTVTHLFPGNTHPVHFYVYLFLGHPINTFESTAQFARGPSLLLCPSRHRNVRTAHPSPASGFKAGHPSGSVSQYLSLPLCHRAKVPLHLQRERESVHTSTHTYSAHTFTHTYI